VHIAHSYWGQKKKIQFKTPKRDGSSMDMRGDFNLAKAKEVVQMKTFKVVFIENINKKDPGHWHPFIGRGEYFGRDPRCLLMKFHKWTTSISSHIKFVQI